ncbi:MAG TPA: nitrophenyl compound nitroreductase subunit ArsF family protein [bacterium]|nr:nitrophenyl compound nitroreductase subunit ArsF family protein [bacterium]
MNKKVLLRYFLLGIVVLSFAAVGVSEWREARSAKPDQLRQEGASVQELPGQDGVSGATQGHKVIAYYFHGNVRCTTCRKIEAFAKESVEKGFAAEIEAGLVEWKTVNVEQAENEHFVQDYQLTTRSVVLSEVVDGTERRWKNLERVWQLVADQQLFSDYVQEQLREYLKEPQA